MVWLFSCRWSSSIGIRHHLIKRTEKYMWMLTGGWSTAGQKELHFISCTSQLHWTAGFTIYKVVEDPYWLPVIQTQRKSSQEGDFAISGVWWIELIGIAVLCYCAPSRRGEKGPELSRGMSNPATQKYAWICCRICKAMFVDLCGLDSWMQNWTKNRGSKFLPKIVKRRNKQQITKSQTR